jgi:hypothetical protein
MIAKSGSSGRSLVCLKPIAAPEDPARLCSPAWNIRNTDLDSRALGCYTQRQSG